MSAVLYLSFVLAGLSWEEGGRGELCGIDCLGFARAWCQDYTMKVKQYTL